jgi:hypothetical protein
MAVSSKDAHFPQEIILTGVRWYVAYPPSTRHVEERTLERGVHVDHATINRWIINPAATRRRGGTPPGAPELALHPPAGAVRSCGVVRHGVCGGQAVH